MSYQTTAIVGREYRTDLGKIVTVENCDDKHGTVRFTNGWLIAYSAFELRYTLVEPIDPSKVW